MNRDVKICELLTGKDECDKTKQEATQPKHDTGKDYLWYERLLGVFGVHVSIASHGWKYYMPSVGVLYHVDNTWLM